MPTPWTARPFTIEVPGDGPVPCDIAVIAEAPGATEVRLKRPLIGTSGDMFWQLLTKYAGLDRGLCYVDNLCQRRLDDEARVRLDREEYLFWQASLISRLDEIRPRLVVSVGALSSKALLGDEFTLHVGHGLPHMHGMGRTVIPCYHPAGALRESKGERDPLALCAYDLTQAGKWWRGELEPNVDSHPPTTVLHKFQPYEWGQGATVAIDTEYIDGEPICLTYTHQPGRAGIIWAHEKEALRIFGEVLQATRPTILFHHASADLGPLRKMGIDILGWGLEWRDTIEQAYLLRTEPLALKDLARRHLALEVEDWSDLVARHYDPKILEAARGAVEAGTAVSPVVTHSPKTGKAYKKPRGGKITRDKPTRAIASALKKKDVGKLRSLLDWPEPSLAFVPEDEIAAYAAKDPDATLRLYRILGASRELGWGRDNAGASSSLGKMEALNEVEVLDNAVVPMFARMSEVGLLFDEEAHAELVSFCVSELERSLATCRDLANVGGDFNPSSSDQVALWCRDEYKRSGRCKLYRQTKGGDQDAADKRALSQILGQHPLIAEILAYRSLAKLKSSYVDKLPGTLKSGRYHPDWRLYGVQSGRVAEWILTFPSRSELGRKIRSCFTAPPGHQLCSFDLSQIELRICAILSKDPLMLKAFAGGADLHQMTVDGVFGGDKASRPAAKIVNFRMLYQGGATALYEGLIQEGIRDTEGNPKFSRDRCAGIIEGWFDTYSGVRELIDDNTKFIRATGYARTELGRRRYLPAIYFEGRQLDDLRAKAVRQGFSHLVSGTAQEVIKRAMVRVWQFALPHLRSRGITVEPLLQYHDELVFQIPEGTWETVQEVIAPCMTADTERYKIPILTEGAVGQRWGDLKG